LYDAIRIDIIRRHRNRLFMRVADILQEYDARQNPSLPANLLAMG